MKISTRLTLAAFVPLFMMLVVGGALIFSFRALNGAQSDSETARQIASSSSDLNGFVYSYILHHEDRPKQQFLAAYASIAQLVSNAHFPNGDQQRLLDTIRVNNETMRKSFLGLVSSYESAGSIDGDALTQQQEEQLTGQILLASQEVHSDALLLETLTDNDLSASHTRIIILIFVVMAVATVPLTVLLFGMRKSIDGSLVYLRKGIQVIGAGDLDHRIDMSGRDELGELARSFDEMTGRLQTVTVSKDALQREVEERRRTEEALRRSEEKFSSLYISMVEGVALHEVVCDGFGQAIDYVITDVNPAFESITGLARHETVGKKASEAYGTGEAPYLDVYAQVASSGKPESFETYFPPMQKHFSITVFSPAKDKFATVFQDITVRKRAEDALRLSEQRWATTLASIGDAVVATDVEAKVMFMNSTAEELTGWTSAEAAGKPVGEVLNIINEQTRETVANPVLRALDDGKIVGLANHSILIGRDGAEIPIDDSAAPIRDAAGGIWGVVLVFRDITERKLAEDELRAALAAKDDFLSMVSHEMRTPLTAILGNALLLLEPALQADETEGREMLRDIAEAAKRLAGTIDNMLALARVETGRKTVIEPLAVQAVVDEMAEQHRLRHTHRKIEVRGAGEPSKVMASREYLAHILSNLLENAEKYTPRDEPIGIELRADGNEATVRVLDRGIGLTLEEAQHIFEPFYRSARIAGTSPGMGIGLSVCKRLVEEQGGRIWVESAGEGRGSAFVFTLPVAGSSLSEA